MSSSSAVVDHLEPVFNVSVPARLDATSTTYVYINETQKNRSVSWCPHPDLDSETRDRLLGAVGRLPRSWLMPPEDGEVFDTMEEGEARLQGHSLAAGYQTVRGQGSKGGRRNIWCIHHGLATRNDRDLSLHVQRNNMGKIISTRKRQGTRSWAKDCKWRGFLTSLTALGSDGAEINQFVWRYGRNQRNGGLPTNVHSHVQLENPLLFPRHRAMQAEFVIAVPQAEATRSA